jgi:hypothetical protein
MYDSAMNHRATNRVLDGAALLDQRVGLAAARLDHRDAFAVAAARAGRNEAIAVTGALLYWLPAGDAAWPEVALALGRLSYDRYTDPWPDAEPPGFTAPERTGSGVSWRSTGPGTRGP